MRHGASCNALWYAVDNADRDLASDICEEIVLRHSEEEDNNQTDALALMCRCSDVHPRYEHYVSSGVKIPGNGKGYGLLHAAVLRGLPEMCDMVLKCAECIGL